MMNALDRRRTLLAALFVAPGFVLPVRVLRDKIEIASNAALTTDQVRGDLIWLNQLGLVTAGPQDTAMITEAGQDIVMGRSPLPGHGA